MGCRPFWGLRPDTAVRDVDAGVGCCRLVGQDQEVTKILRTFFDGAGQFVRGCLRHGRGVRRPQDHDLTRP